MIPISLNDSHSEISTLTCPTSLRNNATSTILTEEEHKEDNNIYNNDDTATHNEIINVTNNYKCSDESLLSLLSSNNIKEAEESLSFHASMINTSCFTNNLTIADHDNNTNCNCSNATNHDRIDVTNIVDIDDNAEQKQQHDDNSSDGDDVIIESIISEMENNTINNNNHDNDNNDHDPCIFHNIGSSLLQNTTNKIKADSNNNNGTSNTIPSFAQCASCHEISIGSHVLNCTNNHAMCYICVMDKILVHNNDNIVDNDWIVLSSSKKICPVCSTNYTHIIPCPSLDKAIYQTILSSSSSCTKLQHDYETRANQYQAIIQKQKLQKQKQSFVQKQYDIENRIMKRQLQEEKKGIGIFWKESIVLFVTVCATIAINTFSNRSSDESDNGVINDSQCSSRAAKSRIGGSGRNRNNFIIKRGR